jgi:hypothetical protein
MSIKIFEGYRIPLHRLVEATKIIHDIQIDLLLNTWQRKVDTGIKLENVSKLYRHYFSIDPSYWEIGFAFWINTQNSMAYIIPYGFPIAGEISKGKVPDWIEDFRYQNQVDEDFYPEGYEKRWTEWAAAGYGQPELQFRHQTVSTVEDIWYIEKLYRENRLYRI